jgi:hypothetical protein
VAGTAGTPQPRTLASSDNEYYVKWRGDNCVDSSTYRWDDGPIPFTQTLILDGEDQKGTAQMEFRLVYKGPLKADTGDGGVAKQKHHIRKEFHKQLKELWQRHPDLRAMTEDLYLVYTTPPSLVSYPGPNKRQIERVMPGMTTNQAPNTKTWLEHIADDHSRCGYRFAPLISKAGGFTCSLDILFLRRDNPGDIIKSGGDIDNRIKTLFDGLREPDTVTELGGFTTPDEGEDPFFCLLEDDNLITKVSVTTDRLLTPLETEAGEHANHVHLVIHVTMTNPSAVFAGNRLV